MAIIFSVQGSVYLFGPLDTDLVKENYLLPKNFSCSEERLVYPPKIYLIGKKKVILENKRNFKQETAIIEYFFSKKGFLLTKISVEILFEEYLYIESDLFSLKDSNFDLENVSLQEMSWKLTEQIFGKSIIEIQLNSELNTNDFNEFCIKYGIDYIGLVTTLSITYLVAISDESNWEKVRNIELQKVKGGSVLRNTVAIPNFDSTAVSLNPDIHILNSTNIIVFTNDYLIKDTINLITGIKFQTFGLNFLKNNLQVLQSNLNQIRNYYRNPGHGQLSWIYIDRALSKLENKFEELISNYEFEFFDLDDPNYVNLQNVTFREKLNFLLEYTSSKNHYLEIKNHVKERIASLRTKVSDKGEKEEQQANDRIFAVVGLLAIFQIVPEILPLFADNLSILIRVVFLTLFFPSLVSIWYLTSYNNQKKIKTAEKLEYQTNLQRQKELLIGNITYFKSTSSQEIIKFSKDALDKEIHAMEEKLDEIETELRKLHRN